MNRKYQQLITTTNKDNINKWEKMGQKLSRNYQQRVQGVNN